MIMHQINITIKSKERLQKKSHETHQNLSEEEKVKKWQYGRERSENLPELKKE